MRRLRSALAAALLIAASTTVGLAAVEGVLRAYNPLPMRTHGDRIVLPQNMRYVATAIAANGLDDRVIHTKNALGFRGAPLPDAPSGALTILAIGGSTTECFYLSDGQDWPALVRAELDETLDRVWLNNAGLDGHSTFGHQVLLRQFVADLSPDVVIYLVGANDVGLSREKQDDRRLGKSLSWSDPRAAVRSLAQVSELAGLLLNVYRSWHTVQLGLAHGAFLIPKDPSEFRPPSARTPRGEAAALLQSHEGYRTLFRERLFGLVSETQTAGILPVLVTQPLLFGEATDPSTGVDLGTIEVSMWGVLADGATQWQLLESYNDVTRSVARETGVPLVDLAAKLPKSSEYYYDTMHFGRPGAVAVARILAADLCAVLAANFPTHAVRRSPT